MSASVESESVYTTRLPNGLTLIVEEMPWVKSAGYDLLIPGGVICDDPSRVGESLILGELMTRGAATYSSRQLSDAFEDAGIVHSEGGGGERWVLRGSLLPEALPRALELVSDIVQRPHLLAEEIPQIQSLLLQDLRGLKDEPTRYAMWHLGRAYYPAPYNRSGLGEESGLQAVTAESIKTLWSRAFAPKGAILSVAGNVKAKEVEALVTRLFGDWKGEGLRLPEFGTLSPFAHTHIPYEAAQLQLAWSYPSAPFGHQHYYAAKVAAGLLSGGMFGRLFIEVREKRGLCYSVSASHASSRYYGVMTVYAGTTPERAHETLEVTLNELRRVAENITEEELSRVKTHIRTALVMGEESSSSRSTSNAIDWWLSGRIRSLEEIDTALTKVMQEDVAACVKAFPCEPYLLVTLGNKNILEGK